MSEHFAQTPQVKLQLLVFCRETSIKFSRGRTWICYTFNIFIIFNIFQSASFTVHFVCHLLSLFPYNHRFISWFEGFFQFHDLKTLKVLIKIITRKNMLLCGDTNLWHTEVTANATRWTDTFNSSLRTQNPSVPFSNQVDYWELGGFHFFNFQVFCTK